MQKIILIVIALSLWLHATPQTLNNMELITNLEKFTPICKYYSGVIKNRHKIKRLCNQYDEKLNNVLRLGNRVDKYIVPATHTHMYRGKEHTCTAQTLKTTKYDNKVLNKYRSDVFSLDKLREEIIEYANSEKGRARRQYDVKYHEKLIRKKDVIELYSDDFIFMGEHKEVYADAQNPIYLEELKKEREELLSQKQREYLAAAQQKEENEKEIEHKKYMARCGYVMTPERHFRKKSGKISGSVTSADINGYFVNSYDGSTFYIVGGPLYTEGVYVTDIPVSSKGENKATTNTNKNSGVITKGVVHKVYYDTYCRTH